MVRFAFHMLLGVILTVLSACGPRPAAPVQPKVAYPEKPVSMVVPFPAGGALDQVTRALVEAVKPYFPQPIAVVNRPGGAGTIGAAELAQARPDGYTVGMMAVGPIAIQPHLTDLPYRGPDDFRPVVKVVYIPVWFMVLQDSPWRSLSELAQHAIVSPGSIRFGSPGVGTIPHINVELLKQRAGISLVHVPFAGGAESVPALLGGHIEALSAHPSEVMGHLKAGKIRVLVTFEERRNPLLPEVPTAKELGYDITLAPYYFVAAPKNVPDDVVNTLHDAFKKAIETNRFKEFAQENGYVIDYKSPSELLAELRRDYETYREIVKN